MTSANMSSIPKNTAESELFGHSKGAFTGAVNNKVGLITSAHSQVFFLDEIGDCPQEVQTKLLRVIQEKEVQPLGSVHPKKIDVRFIAATHQQLHEKVDSGEFRLDLLQRINTFTFEIPPLRERPEDIELFSQIFLSSSKDVFRLEPSGLRALQSHHWPGNVRELRNVIERIQVCSQRKIVDECSVKEALNISGGLSQMSDVLNTGKSGNILRAIKEAGGNKTKAARLLGVHKATLYRWIDDLGLTDAVSVKSGRPSGSRAFPSFNKEGALS